MVERGIFRGRFVTKFQSEPTNGADGINLKPDTGRENHNLRFTPNFLLRNFQLIKAI